MLSTLMICKNEYVFMAIYFRHLKMTLVVFS